MLEKLILTLSSVTLAFTLGAGYVWAEGGFEPSQDLSSVAEAGPGARAYTGPTTVGSDVPQVAPTATPATPPTPRRAAVRAARKAARAAAGASLVGRTAAGAVPYDGRTVVAAGTQQTGSAGSTATPTQTGPRADFNVATFNLLGSSHTRGSGGMASGPARMPGALRVLAQHDVTVVGFQEFQPDQRQAFTQQARGWAMYPGLSMGRRAGENSVAWRTDTWSLVDKGLVSIPYFSGRERPMPWVLLRNAASGRQVYVSTFHNPADVHGPAQRWRTEATNREVRLFNRLEATGTPQLVTGDMNERANYFCRITSETKLHAAAGGNHDGACHLPQKVQIDWIFGSPSVAFSNFTVDRSDLVRRTTDHPVVVSHVTLGGTQ